MEEILISIQELYNNQDERNKLILESLLLIIRGSIRTNSLDELHIHITPWVKEKLSELNSNVTLN